MKNYLMVYIEVDCLVFNHHSLSEGKGIPWLCGMWIISLLQNSIIRECLSWRVGVAKFTVVLILNVKICWS